MLVNKKRFLETGGDEKSSSFNDKKKFKGNFNQKQKVWKKTNIKNEKFKKQLGKTSFKQKPDGKTDWNDVKTKKKQLKEQRKKQKAKTETLYQTTVEVKKVYEMLKCKSAQNKPDLCRQLHSLLKTEDGYTKLIYSHDIARIVQTLLKYSPGEIKLEITNILLPNVVQMATSKYTTFVVKRLLKYGTRKTRTQVITAFFKNIFKLLMHNLSNSLIDIAYNNYCSPEEKARFRQEFYSDLFKLDNHDNINALPDTWKNSPEMKKMILSSTKSNLQKCANKSLVDNGLVHFVLIEYLKECSESEKEEMVQTFSNLFPQLCTTKDGTQASISLFLFAKTKDRRAILKSLKEHIETLCNHEFGHLLVINILNCTDDTVILQKMILSTILKNVEKIAENQFGRKVLEWTVSPEDPTFFHPQFNTTINQGLTYSKKDANIRRKEILAIVSKPLSLSIVENPDFWLKTGSIGLLTYAILKNFEDADVTTEACKALAKVICAPDWEVYEEELKHSETVSVKVPIFMKNPIVTNDDKDKEDEKEKKAVKGIEHPGLHVVLKKIIKMDKEKMNNELSSSVVKNLSSDTLEKWIRLNRACFILLTILENSNEDVQIKLKNLLDKKKLKEQDHPAAKILIKKL